MQKHCCYKSEAKHRMTFIEYQIYTSIPTNSHFAPKTIPQRPIAFSIARLLRTIKYKENETWKTIALGPVQGTLIWQVVRKYT